MANLVDEVKPDFIVPEIEAIRTEELLNIENKGITVVPSARAVNLTMNRDAIRDRATELGIKTAKYKYAHSLDELDGAIKTVGFPCIVKPVMSSSGKGQTLIKAQEEVPLAWENATKNMRGDRVKVIIEEFINFISEITLLTIRQSNSSTIFCPPIGHKQEQGDYIESWQPENINQDLLSKAKNISEKITKDLGGNGLFGVEFFITTEDIIFSELSPRPHDTGMVTMYTQNLSEFDLHARAILSYPINSVLIPEMIKNKWGRVIHVSSISAKMLRGNPLYASSKAFLNAYVKTVGRQVAQSGVVMSAVMPGAVAFKNSYWEKTKKDNPAKVNDFLSHHQAVGRFGTPEEIANMVLFLGSEKASFMQAAIVPIDGGNM